MKFFYIIYHRISRLIKLLYYFTLIIIISKVLIYILGKEIKFLFGEKRKILCFLIKIISNSNFLKLNLSNLLRSYLLCFLRSIMIL